MLPVARALTDPGAGQGGSEEGTVEVLALDARFRGLEMGAFIGHDRVLRDGFKMVVPEIEVPETPVARQRERQPATLPRTPE